MGTTRTGVLSSKAIGFPSIPSQKDLSNTYDIYDTNQFTPGAKRMKHITTKNTKTPMQMIHDPLNVLNWETNNSQRED